jgi:hypothetical protein
MNSIYFDSPLKDDVRRQHLYNGQIFVYSPCKSAVALCEFARELIYEAFGTIDPIIAQYYMASDKYMVILAQF